MSNRSHRKHLHCLLFASTALSADYSGIGSTMGMVETHTVATTSPTKIPTSSDPAEGSFRPNDMTIVTAPPLLLTA